jgi:hypothetical protein
VDAPLAQLDDPALGGALDLAAIARAGLLGELPRWRAIAVEERGGAQGAI